MKRSQRKSEFLLRECDVFDRLQAQKEVTERVNQQLSMHSAEAAHLQLTCTALKTEVSELRVKAAPLSARVTELEKELIRVAVEQDAARDEAKREATSIETLWKDLVMLSNARDMQEVVLTKAQEEATLVPSLHEELSTLWAAHQQTESDLVGAKAAVEVLWKELEMLKASLQ